MTPVWEIRSACQSFKKSLMENSKMTNHWKLALKSGLSSVIPLQKLQKESLEEKLEPTKIGLTRMTRRLRMPSILRTRLSSSGKTIRPPSLNVTNSRPYRPKSSLNSDRCRTNGGNSKQLKLSSTRTPTTPRNSSAH